MALRFTSKPEPAICREVRGRSTPSCRYTYCTKPEQSNPCGVDPPQTYGTPMYRSPSGMTRRAAPAALVFPAGHTVPPDELPPPKIVPLDERDERDPLPNLS